MDPPLVFKCLVAWAVAIINLPIYIFLAVALFTFRFVTSIYCKIIHPNFVRCQSSDNSVYCILTKDQTHGCLFVLKGKVNTRDFFITFLEKVVNVKDVRNFSDPHIRFFQRPIEFWGQLFLKTYENIFYDNHIHSITIPNDSTRNDYIKNWIAKPFKTDCPTWEILFLAVEGLDEVNLVFKFDHVIGDGYSLLHIMDLLTNTSYKYQVKDFQDTFGDKAQMLFELPYRFYEFTNQDFTNRNGCELLTQDISNSHFYTTVSLPLTPLKEIRRNANVHFASVMFCLIKMAFFNSCVSTNKSCLMPFSLPWPHHPKTKITNHFTVAKLLFTPNSTTNGYENLMEVEEMYQALHRKYFNRIANWSMDLFSTLPLKVHSKLINGVTNATTIFFSHMLGSENYSSVFGSTIKDVSAFGWMKLPVIWIYGMTTNNEVKLTITGRGVSQFKPDTFAKCIQDELEILSSSCAKWKSE